MKAFFSSSITIIVLIAFIILLGFSFFKNLTELKDNRVEQEGLRSDLEGIIQQNQEIQESIEFFETDKALEFEARIRFNLKKAGEEVVVLYPSDQHNRKPLTDDEFLRLYNEKNNLKEDEVKEEEEGSSFMSFIRSAFSYVLKEREEEII